MSFILTVVIATLISSLILLFTWIYANRIQNYSIVDAVWAFCFFILSCFYAALSDGYFARKILMLFCVGLWSLRLGSFLWLRIRSHHPKEDNRYVELRKSYEPNVKRGFFWFFQYQAWSVVLLTVPFLIIARNPEPKVQLLEWVGFGAWAFSLLGEAIADHQAKIFKTDPKNAKRVCDEGLWKYSRHPNYFFESCIWIAYFIFASASPGGLWCVYCPIIMILLLTRVTGVPLSEKQSLKNKGDAYREYQRKTSVFVPWFPKAVIFMVMSLGVTHLANAVAPTDRTAKIYEVGKTSGEPLFLQSTHFEEKDGVTESSTKIVDASGKTVLTENATYRGPHLISQQTDQLQTDKHYKIEVKNDHIFFSEGKKESSEGLFDDFVTGPTSENFLNEHWDALMAGKTVSCRFGVNEVKETVGFEFKMAGKKKIGDQEAIWIKMKPSSMFISIVVDEIDLYIDPQTKRYLKFVGRTPLQKKVNGKLTPLDGELIYHY
jgi:steroid 5-alpha reductase family enzyme